jgi:hypothetical protein
LPLARLRKRGMAAITLDSLSSVESKSLCFVVLASQAGHTASPLVFLREKPEYEGLGFRLGLSPRLDSAPSLVQASDGALAFSVCMLRLNEGFEFRGRRHCFPSPSVCKPIFARSNFFVFHHSLQSRMDARHHVLVSTEVLPSIPQLLSNLYGTEQIRVGNLENFSNIFSDSFCFDFRENGIPKALRLVRFFCKRCKRHDGLFQLSDFLFSILLKFEKAIKFLPHLLKHLFVFLFCHVLDRGEIYHYA